MLKLLRRTRWKIRQFAFKLYQRVHILLCPALRRQFTLDDAIPFKFLLCDNRRTYPAHITDEVWKRTLQRIADGSFAYYGATYCHIQQALAKYDLKGKTVLIAGLEACNCEMISIYHGAAQVYVADYQPVIHDHPKIESCSIDDFASRNIKVDVIFSISSFEHDGLGRYGDPLQPDGDFRAMQTYGAFLKDDGIMLLAVPCGPDCIAFNAHRIYGKIRLPMLLKGYDILDSYGFSESMLEGEANAWAFAQPVFVLQKHTLPAKTNTPIPQMEPAFDEREIEAVTAYMRGGGWLTEFRKTREFEQAIADFTGAKHCSVVGNGTVSLVIALLALGVKAGDEVIVPDYTMVATANAPTLIAAKPVFCDIEPQTLGLDFAAVQQAVTPRTRAVIIVAINGRAPRDLEKICAFCRERGIAIVEDVAQALGCWHNNRHLGTFGDIGSLSFSAPKVITTGQGGALLTNNDELMERIRKIRDFGREKAGEDHYLTAGWNFKFTDLQAVIGLEQMKKLPSRLERKKQMGRLYDRLFKDIPHTELISTDYDQTSPWFFDLLCDSRADLMHHLRGQGIGVRPFYPPLHSEPVFELAGSYPVTESIASRGLWLPSSIKVTDKQIEHICACIRAFYAQKEKA